MVGIFYGLGLYMNASDATLIGRQPELETLQRLLATVSAERNPWLVTVVGEVGLGKSRLFEAFLQQVAANGQQLHLFRGRADPQASHRPYALFRSLMSQRFDIQPSDPPMVARKKLEQGVATVLGVGGPLKAHFIGHLLGFQFADSPHLRALLGNARQIRDRAFFYLVQFFQAITDTSPLRFGVGTGGMATPAILRLEDLQWADDASLDLIEYLVQEGRETPLLIVGLTRPLLFERRPRWGAEVQRHLTLTLEPLSPDQSDQLLETLLADLSELPPPVRHVLTTRAAGNPLFLIELITMLRDEGGRFTAEGGGWSAEAQRLTEERLPPTLVGLMETRLAQLQPHERALLQRAAIFGSAFWDGAVAALGAEPLEAVVPALATLVAQELVVPAGTQNAQGHQFYLFRQNLMPDVIYGSIPAEARPALHAQAAAWMIDQGEEGSAENAGLIGMHLERAGQTREAADWYAQAAQHAYGAYALTDTLGFAERALQYLPARGEGAEHRLPLLWLVGRTLFLQTRPQEAIAALQAMYAEAEAQGNPTAQARALVLLADVAEYVSDMDQVLEYGQRAEVLAREAGEGAEVELARALLQQGVAHFRMGHAELSRELGEQSLALSRQLGAQIEMGLGINLLGNIAAMRNEYEQAIAAYDEALPIFEAAGSREWVAGIFNNLGEVAREQGDYEEAVVRYRQALEVANEVGARPSQMIARINLGSVLVALGDYETAERELRQVITEGEPTGWFGLSEAYASLARAHLGAGEPSDAFAAAERALALAQTGDQPEDLAAAWRVVGQVVADLGWQAAVRGQPVPEGGWPDAEAAFAESQRLFQAIGSPGEEASTLREWARYELARGNTSQGESLWQAARERFEQLGMAREMARMDAERG